MSDLKLEAGKTYVFIDDDARDGYISESEYNVYLYGRKYQGGFTLDKIKSSGGMLDGCSVILSSETKYFKLKETKMKATDIVNVEMTALQAMKLKALLGTCNGDSSDIYIGIGRLLGELNKLSPKLCLNERTMWDSDSKLTKWALSQFEPEKTERQIKIEKLRKTIDDAKAQIEALEG